MVICHSRHFSLYRNYIAAHLIDFRYRKRVYTIQEVTKESCHSMAHAHMFTVLVQHIQNSELCFPEYTNDLPLPMRVQHPKHINSRESLLRTMAECINHDDYHQDIDIGH